MRSMTGYGEASQPVRGTRISVQVRSLNHRHLDLQLRVPREYLSFEEEIRKSVRDRVSRGRIEIFVNRLAEKGQARRLEMDEELLGQYLVSVRRAQKKFNLSGELGVALFSSFPDVFHIKDVEVDAAGEKRALFSALENALKKLQQSRDREGKRLRSDMQAQIHHLRRIAAELEARAVEVGTRLQKTPVAGRDAENLLRAERESSEPANWAVKGDINEEIVRLKSHVAALHQMLRETEPVGKKVDFLLQEVQRELNTIGSKVPQLAVVQMVLEGKERVEKIREQTQNIE